MNIKVLIYTFLISLLCQPTWATKRTPHQFKHYNREDGLISNSIQSIVEDQNGLIWIGTNNGLCSFDGYSFQQYRNTLSPSSSINDNYTCSIASDSSRQCLWIVTASVISRFDLNTYQFKNYNISNIHRTDYTPFAQGSICVDSENNIWAIGFNEGFSQGLFKYDVNADEFVNLTELRSDVPKGLTVVTEDKNNTLWFGSSDGLYYYHPINKTFVSINYESQDGTPLHIYALHADADNTLWIGTQYSNALFVCKNNVITKIFESKDITTKEINFISSISELNEDIIVAGIKDKGLMFYNKKTATYEILQPNLYNTRGIQSKTPQTIYTDKIGNVWIGSYSNGINLIDKNSKSFDHYSFDYTPYGLLTNKVRAFFEDSDGDLWIGTKEGGGISQFFPEKGIFNNYKADESKANWLTNDIVISINELEPGKLLIGTFGSGIFTYHKNTNSFSQFSIAEEKSNSISDNSIYAIYKDKEGNIWVGNNSTVDIYNPKTKTFSNIEGVTYARCFLDVGDKVLIGTWSKGLYIYSKEDQQTELYKLEDSTSTLNNNIRFNAIEQDSAGLIWFATNKGLIKYNAETNDIKVFREDDGLASQYICAVLVDNKNDIWVSTKNGISEIIQETSHIKNYDKSDGLQSSSFEDFASLKMKNGNLLFAGTNGFNIFNPMQIKDNPNIPNVRITEMSILNEPVEIGTEDSPLKKHISVTKNITLTHEQSSFSFQFTALNYTSPEKNKYKYKLEGYDNDWQVSRLERTAIYTQVPAGNYTFRVIASNNDDLWNNVGVSLKIEIKPPIWKSKAAIVIYFIVIVLFLLLLRAIIVRDQENKSRILAEISEKKIIEQTGRNRLRFFTNISHELRTPLTLITSPLEGLMNYETTDERLKSTIRNMNRNAQRLLRLVNQLMDFRKVEENRIRLRISNGQLVKDIKDVLHSFEYLAESKKIKLVFKSDVKDSEEFWYDPNFIDKILFNLLSNAIKFTNENGTIQVEVEIENDHAILRVSDDGVGIEEELQERVFERFYTTEYDDHHETGTGIGLAFCKSLVELHKGTISVKSTLGEGSCFKIKIPISKVAFTEKEISLFNINDKKEIDVQTTKILTAEESPEHSHNYRKEVLMIVEDYDDLRDYLAESFSDYKVVVCKNGKEAMEQAQTVMPDLILSDVMMPEMDGLELCHYIKTNIITSHIPVILLTAKSEVANKLEGFKQKADAYIEKPFNINLLRVQVDNLITLRKSIKKKYSTNTFVKESKDTPPPIDNIFLNKVNEIVSEKLNDYKFSVESLSTELGISRSQLFRKFKVVMDTSPSSYIRLLRLQKAATLLETKKYNVNEVTYMVGFSDVSHFIAAFKKHFGQTPKQFSEN